MPIIFHPERTMSVAFDVLTQIPGTPLRARHRGPKTGWVLSAYKGDAPLDINLIGPNQCTFYTTIAISGLPLLYFDLYFQWPEEWQEGGSAVLHYRIYEPSP